MQGQVSNPLKAQRPGPMLAQQAFAAQHLGAPGPLQARPAVTRLSHLPGCWNVRRLSDKDQEETQMSTRAVHILQVSWEQGWAVPEAPSLPFLRLLTVPCCLAEESKVKKEGIWSVTHGAQAWQCTGCGGLREVPGCKPSQMLPLGPGIQEEHNMSQPCVQGSAQCLL